MIDYFYDRQAIAAFLCVKPPQSWHAVNMDECGTVQTVRGIAESDVWMNGGYFVLSQEIFDYMEPGEELVCEPFQRLIDHQKLCAYKYEGFWGCMDTFKEKQRLDDMYASGEASGRSGGTPPAPARSVPCWVPPDGGLNCPNLVKIHGRGAVRDGVCDSANRHQTKWFVMRKLSLGTLQTILCLGAHADDIEIGCGGTLLKLLAEQPGVAVHWIVFSGSETRPRKPGPAPSGSCKAPRAGTSGCCRFATATSLTRAWRSRRSSANWPRRFRPI